MKSIVAFLLPKRYVEELTQAAVRAAIKELLLPENLHRFKDAMKTITGDSIREAAKPDERDEKIQQKIQDTGLDFGDLPEHPKG